MESDLPQFGSEDDDETRLMEPTGSKTTTSAEVAAEAINAAEACSIAKDPYLSYIIIGFYLDMEQSDWLATPATSPAPATVL